MIDENDRELLKRAASNVSEANAVIQFLANYFRDKYKLQPGQRIQPDGTITNPLPLHFGVPNQNGRTQAAVDMREVSGDMAVLRETNGDT